MAQYIQRTDSITLTINGKEIIAKATIVDVADCEVEQADEVEENEE